MDKIRLGELLKIFNDSKKSIIQPAFINGFINSMLEILGCENRVVLSDSACSRIITGDSDYKGASNYGGRGIPHELYIFFNNLGVDSAIEKTHKALKIIDQHSFTYKEENYILNFDADNIAKKLREEMELSSDIFNEKINVELTDRLFEIKNENYLLISYVFVYSVLFISNWKSEKKESNPVVETVTSNIVDKKIYSHIGGFQDDLIAVGGIEVILGLTPRLVNENGVVELSLCTLPFFKNKDNFKLLALICRISPTVLYNKNDLKQTSIVNSLFLCGSYNDSTDVIKVLQKFPSESHYARIKSKFIDLLRVEHDIESTQIIAIYLTKSIVEFLLETFTRLEMPHILMLEIGSQDYYWVKKSGKIIKSYLEECYGDSEFLIKMIKSPLFDNGALISSMAFNVNNLEP